LKQPVTRLHKRGKQVKIGIFYRKSTSSNTTHVCLLKTLLL